MQTGWNKLGTTRGAAGAPDEDLAIKYNLVYSEEKINIII